MITELFDLADTGADGFTGPPTGPPGKRAYGGLLAAQALAAACATVPAGRIPTALHVQFLRGGDAGEPVRYQVERTHDGRSSSSRRLLCRQGERLLASATALFAQPSVGPEHSDRAVGDPEDLPRTGPIGPAPAMPLDEIDIRIGDDRGGGEFVRRLWWRVLSPLPDDAPVLNACLAVFVTDIYGVDPVLAVHGHSMTDRSHRSATTDSSIWFHRAIRADRWNLLECRSPAATGGRGLMTAGLYDDAGLRAATLVHEGQVVRRDGSGGAET